MSFDVYVGTLTRYYRREWETKGQRFARETGTRHRTIYAEGRPDAPPLADDIRQAVTGWCVLLSAKLKPHKLGPVTWDESDQRPYFTDRPDWEGYSALLVWAAHADHPSVAMPDTVPQQWATDPAFHRSIAPGFQSRFRSILEPQIWIPGEFPLVIQAETVASAEKRAIGSVFTLKRQLDDLYTQTAKQLGNPPADVARQVPAPPKPGLFARLLGRKPPEQQPPGPPLVSTAAYSLDIFRKLAAQACEHRLPLVLDY
jgi:hypothetical protein